LDGSGWREDWERLQGPATFDAWGLTLNGHRVPLVGAEFHFWRQQAGFWRASLGAIARSGIPLVSTFVCWDFHELEPGRFDFDGSTRPERNLAGFLDLCAELGLLVILRPGPIIDAEWETRGPARDVCELERGDPRFIARATDYLKAIAEVASPRQISRGGAIALMAVDNEIYFPYASDPAWHDEDGDVFISYKREFVRDRWREWLRGRFTDVAALNEAFGTAHDDIDSIDVPRFSSAGPAEIAAAFELIDHYCGEYLDGFAQVLREGGIEIPMYTNQKQFLSYFDWSSVGRSLDSVGINICMPNLVRGRQALAMSWFVRLQCSRPGFPWSPEFQCGWIGFDEYFGVISPEHGLYMGLLGAALGLRGMSFFMFVERDDWNYSPVNSFGKVRPARFEAYRRLVAVMKALEPDRHLADVGLLWSLSEHREHLAATTEGWEDLFKHWMEFEEGKEAPRWWSTFTVLHEQDADFRVIDISSDVGGWPPVVIYAGDGNLSQPESAQLEAALNAGIPVVAAGRLPPSLAGRAGVHPATPGTAWSVSTGAGAATYLQAGDGLWSFAYEEDGGTICVFVVNPTDSAIPATPGGRISQYGESWSDLLSGARGWGTLSAAIGATGALIEPKTARVVRLSGVVAAG